MAIPVTVWVVILGTTVSTGWTSSVPEAGGGAQPVAPATVMFTRALTPTATRQMDSVTARSSTTDHGAVIHASPVTATPWAPPRAHVHPTVGSVPAAQELLAASATAVIVLLQR